MLSSLPQVVVLLRASHAQGVSFASCVLAVLSSVAWLAYGLLILDPAQLVSNVPGLTGAVCVLLLVRRRHGLPPAPVAAMVVGWVVVVAALAVFAGAGTLGVVATLVCVVSRGPQVAQALSG